MKIDIDRAIEVLSACGYECDEIESLRQQLADAQEDNLRLATQTDETVVELSEYVDSLEKQLAASQEREAKAIAACKLKDEALQNCEDMLDDLRDYPI